MTELPDCLPKTILQCYGSWFVEIACPFSDALALHSFGNQLVSVAEQQGHLTKKWIRDFGRMIQA